MDAGSLYQFIAFDVTEAVRGWLADPTTNFGLAVTGSGAVSIKLDSKESKKAGQPAMLEDRKSTRPNSSHVSESRMPSSA